MKKFYYSIILFVIMLLQACTNQTELIFDESASARMAITLKEYKQLLVSNPDGWLVDYYPQASRDYGGYQLFFRFAEGEVTVKSEVKSSLLTVDESTSFYSLGEDMGPTLNFDTYNEILNFFSDPALNVGGGAGFGYEGDYEFVFMSGNASEIILCGKKTKNTIRLTPFPATTTWQEYCDGIQTIKDALFTKPLYGLYVDGENVGGITKSSSTYNILSISYNEDGELNSIKMPYVVTPAGIRFYEELTVNGVAMQEFRFDETSGEMASIDGKVVTGLPAVDYVFATSMSSASWYMSSASMGSGFAAEFANAKSDIEDLTEQLAYAWIGTSVSTGKPSFSFGCFDGSQVWYGSILYDVTKVGTEAQIQINIVGTSEINGTYYTTNAPALGTFINSLKGTYNITTADPPDNISTVTFTDPADANRWMKLTLDKVEFP